MTLERILERSRLGYPVCCENADLEWESIFADDTQFNRATCRACGRRFDEVWEVASYSIPPDDGDDWVEEWYKTRGC